MLVPQNNKRSTSDRNTRSQDPGGSDPIRQKKLRSSRNRRRTRSRRKRFDPKGRAEHSLRNFRQASILAVVLTGFLLVIFSSSEAQTDPQQLPDTVAVIENIAVDDIRSNTASSDQPIQDVDISQAAGEAWGTVREMLRSFFRMLPRIGVAIVILLLVWLLAKGANAITRRLIRNWERTEGVTTLITMLFWAIGIGLALSVVAGDIRALIGSLGLVGLALSWALQSPIESATGWLLNKFKGYYRVGDRIVVAGVFGDVYKIDLINTTLWEVGDPFSPGFVNAEQPTGRLVTFPNSEILNGIVVNLTSDYPYVWDELSNAVANESDLRHALAVVKRIAHELLAESMKGPAEQYERILQEAGLEQHVPREPQVFLSSTDSWTDVVVRYLVPARERRKWKSELLLRITEEFNRAEHQQKIIPVYPRRQVQFIDPQGRPVAAPERSDR
jgi:small-conductance mechanosensitive channel